MTAQEVKDILEQNRFVSKYKHLIIILSKIVIAGGLLTYVISTVKLDEIFAALNGANLFLIAIAFLLSFVNLYLQFLKWKTTTSAVLQVEDNGRILQSLFEGFSAGVFTPARVGEYIGRALVFNDKSLLKVTIATLLDKFFPLLMVAFFGSIASILFIHYYYHVTFYITIGLFILLFTFFYLLLLLMFNDRFWDNILFTRIRESKRFGNIFDKLKVFRKLDRSYAVKMFVISFLFYSCFLVQYALLVMAFSHHYSFIDYLWAGNLIMFAKTIIPPVSLGELGIREGASVFFITQLGESASIGFNASIFLFTINVLIPALIGLSLLLKKSDD